MFSLLSVACTTRPLFKRCQGLGLHKIKFKQAMISLQGMADKGLQMYAIVSLHPPWL